MVRALKRSFLSLSLSLSLLHSLYCTLFYTHCIHSLSLSLSFTHELFQTYTHSFKAINIPFAALFRLCLSHSLSLPIYSILTQHFILSCTFTYPLSQCVYLEQFKIHTWPDDRICYHHLSLKTIFVISLLTVVFPFLCGSLFFLFVFHLFSASLYLCLFLFSLSPHRFLYVTICLQSSSLANLSASFLNICPILRPNEGHTLFRLFSVFFKQTSIQFLQQINVKNVYPLYGDVSRTHDL